MIQQRVKKEADTTANLPFHNQELNNPKGMRASGTKSVWIVCVVALLALAVLFMGKEGAEAEKEFDETTVSEEGSLPVINPGLRIASWNMAAINNNPFEYWITYEDADYNHLMAKVQDFINDPGENDVPVESVFTQAMFDEVRTL
jgi:hypothetical protein